MKRVVDVAELMSRIHEDVDRQLASAGPVPAPPTPDNELTLPRMQVQPPVELSAGCHVRDLLNYHDAQFIRAAYRVILGRLPDEGGSSRWLDRLRGGEAKVMVLGRMRYSAEGRRCGRDVRGLRLRLAGHLLLRVPIVGYIARVVLGAAQLPRLADQRRRFEHHVMALANQQQDVFNDLAERLEKAHRGLRRRLAADAEEIKRLGDAARQIDGRLGEEITRLDADIGTTVTRLDADIGTTVDRLDAQDRRDDQLERSLREARQHLDSRLDELYARVSELANIEREVGELLLARGVRTAAAELSADDDHELDELYVAFEDQFRGTAQQVKDKTRDYLEYIRQSGAGTEQAPVLDIGCGRGEWLAMLAEQGLVARGVDINQTMVDRCLANGLDAGRCDAMAALRDIRDAGLGAITGFHIVEHLPQAMLLLLFAEAHRVLAPGGVAIFETPNPHNLIVAGYGFYTDPTHRNPIPAETLEFQARRCGFGRTQIHSPDPPPVELGDDYLNGFFNTWVNRHPDYALIAWKASSDG